MDEIQMQPVNQSETPEITIKIRSLDKEFSVKIQAIEKIEELKRKIQVVSDVPTNRQRLIFRGRVLKNEDSINDSKITDNDVIHLVAKVGDIEQNENNQNNASNSSNTGGTFSRFVYTRNPVMSFMNQSFGQRYGSSGRRNSRNSRNNANFNGIECKEAISQNLLSLNNLLNCGNYDNKNYPIQSNFEQQPEINEINDNAMDISKEENTNSKPETVQNINESISNQTEQHNNLFIIGQSNPTTENVNNINNIPTMQCFDLEKRVLVKGQWIDAKDTVDQWLEAQVVKVNEEQRSVFIHYNGWGTRWDEWIPMNSPRIMPFRFHTRQTTFSNFQSPFPNVKPDANVSLLSSCTSKAQESKENTDEQITIDNNPNINFNNNKNNTSNMNMNMNENNNVNIIKTDNFSFINSELKPPVDTSSEFSILNTWVNGDFINIFSQLDKINTVAKDLIQKITSPDDNIMKSKKDQQLETFYNIKKLIPLLDKTGRIYTDISTYLNFTIKNNKLEELNKNLFQNFSNINPLLRPYTEEEQTKVNEEILSQNSARTNRSGTFHFIPPSNQYDRSMNNQIPIIDTPLTIFSHNTNTHPVDIYVHTFYQTDRGNDSSNNPILQFFNQSRVGTSTSSNNPSNTNGNNNNSNIDSGNANRNNSNNDQANNTINPQPSNSSANLNNSFHDFFNSFRGNNNNNNNNSPNPFLLNNIIPSINPFTIEQTNTNSSQNKNPFIPETPPNNSNSNSNIPFSFQRERNNTTNFNPLQTDPLNSQQSGVNQGVNVNNNPNKVDINKMRQNLGIKPFDVESNQFSANSKKETPRNAKSVEEYSDDIEIIDENVNRRPLSSHDKNSVSYDSNIEMKEPDGMLGKKRKKGEQKGKPETQSNDQNNNEKK